MIAILLFSFDSSLLSDSIQENRRKYSFATEKIQTEFSFAAKRWWKKKLEKTILKNSTMLSMLNVYINCDRFIIKENNTNFQKILIFNGMTSNVIKFMFFFPSLRNSFYSQSDRIEMSFTFTYDCSCSMRAVWHIQNNHFLLVGILFSKIKWNICLGNVPVR